MLLLIPSTNRGLASTSADGHDSSEESVLFLAQSVPLPSSNDLWVMRGWKRFRNYRDAFFRRPDNEMAPSRICRISRVPWASALLTCPPAATDAAGATAVSVAVAVAALIAAANRCERCGHRRPRGAAQRSLRRSQWQFLAAANAMPGRSGQAGQESRRVAASCARSR